MAVPFTDSVPTSQSPTPPARLHTRATFSSALVLACCDGLPTSVKSPPSKMSKDPFAYKRDAALQARLSAEVEALAKQPVTLLAPTAETQSESGSLPSHLASSFAIDVRIMMLRWVDLLHRLCTDECSPFRSPALSHSSQTLFTPVWTHRALGAHVTGKCLRLDAWKPEEVELLTA